jgi:uncharacterized membrane protein YqjE
MSPPPHTEGGVIRQLREYAVVFGQYVAARYRLARLEGKEAGAHLLKLLGLLVALLTLAMFGWLFLCLGVVALLAGQFAAHGWLWGSLIVAGAHFLLVLMLGKTLKAQAEAPLFPLTTEELKKDQEWLETQTKQP